MLIGWKCAATNQRLNFPATANQHPGSWQLSAVPPFTGQSISYFLKCINTILNLRQECSKKYRLRSGGRSIWSTKSWRGSGADISAFCCLRSLKDISAFCCLRSHQIEQLCSAKPFLNWYFRVLLRISFKNWKILKKTSLYFLKTENFAKKLSSSRPASAPGPRRSSLSLRPASVLEPTLSLLPDSSK